MPLRRGQRDGALRLLIHLEVVQVQISGRKTQRLLLEPVAALP
jgi:hypothetical protein